MYTPKHNAASAITRIIQRDALPSDYREMMEKETHHTHAIIEDEHGTYRWEPDPFTVKLIDATNLNFVIQGLYENGATKNSEIYRELYRKMGYSLSGYWEIFYWEVNNPDAKQYTSPASNTDIKNNELTTSSDQYKALGINISHFSAQDIETLTSMANDENTNMVVARETGFFIKLYDDVNAEYQGATIALQNLFKTVRQAGYRLIEVDTDAKTYNTLETFE